jgi:prevent-host-death family protein
MKIESLRAVKNNLSSVIEQLEDTGPVLITKHGTRRAILLPVGESTDIESLVLAANPRFWEMFDRAARSKSWTNLEDL